VIQPCQFQLLCYTALSVPVIVLHSPISSGYCVIQPCHFQLLCYTALSVPDTVLHSPVSSSYCVIQPCQFQLLCYTALSVPVIVLHSPVSSSYCVTQPYKFQLLCDTTLSVPVIVLHSPVSSRHLIVPSYNFLSFLFRFIIVPTPYHLPRFSFPRLLFCHACSVAQIQHNLGSHGAGLITVSLRRIQMPGLNRGTDGAKAATLLGEREVCVVA